MGIFKHINRNWNKFWNITKPYNYQGMVYLNKRGIPVESEITDTVKWLGKITINKWSEKDASVEAFKFFNKKYPEYKGKIWLF